LLGQWDILFKRDELDLQTMKLLGADLAVLVILFLSGQILRRRSASTIDPAVVRSFNNRLGAWISVCVILALALTMAWQFTFVFFGLVSFWALREFITMTPTRRGDHRTLFWVFFLFTPLQYVLVALDEYALFTIVIPVYASLFVAARIAFAGDHKRFLERIAKIQFGLLICVYALSHAPALLNLKLNHWNSQTEQLEPWGGDTGGLLVYFIVIVQVSDLLHFVWDRAVGKHVIARAVNATKTWEGLVGAACCTAIAGMLIQAILPVTPFLIIGSGCMALIISVMASSGSMTMSAIKRDRGVHDFGTLVQGHAGVLDRIDSICFAAPIFFHVTRLQLGRPDVIEPVQQAARTWLLGG